MNKKITRRIITLSVAFLMLISFTSIGYKIGFDNRIYASEQIISEQAKKLAPIVGWMALNYNKVEQTAENLSTYIGEVKDKWTTTYNSLSSASKVINAMVFTDYSLEEVNNIYGTSYTMNTLNEYGLQDVKNKMIEGLPLDARDMHLLGIDKLLANEIKSNQSVIAIKNTNVDEYGFQHLTISNRNIKTNLFEYDKVILNQLPFQFKYSQSMSATAYYITRNAEVYMNHNNQYYKMVIYSQHSGPANGDIPLGSQASNGNIKFYSMENSEWVLKSTSDIRYENNDLLDAIYTETGVNVTTISRYGEDLYKSFPPTWIGNNISFGDPSLLYTVFTPTADIFGEFTGADNNIDAEAIIGNIAAQGEDTNEIEIGVSGYENTDTGEPEIIVIPTGTTGSDTGTSNPDIPDTSGDTNINEDGTGMLNIPILGTILRWLQRIWQMAKDIYDLVLNHFQNPTSTDTGTDWGNFTNFFDIFWIFYYLIILAIIILLKFFSVIMSILTIPANTALFDQYPTMLSGLNYIKNIKVGGFTVTLQTIFEYMFTVFFFLYIVTTLQKLYHSFMGIERQTIRENEREARIEQKNSDYLKQNKEVWSDYYHGSSEKPYGFGPDPFGNHENYRAHRKEAFGPNINYDDFKDEDYENIKFTGWGD